MFSPTGQTSTLFPFINACLNGLSFVLLCLGYFYIKKGDQKAHKNAMTAAFMTSTLLLASYLYYHFDYDSQKFSGEGPIRVVYFIILISHIILATVMVPFILFLLWAALKKNFVLHKKIARWTWPTWVCVSATGVLVYLFLYQWFPSNSHSGLTLKSEVHSHEHQ